MPSASLVSVCLFVTLGCSGTERTVDPIDDTATETRSERSPTQVALQAKNELAKRLSGKLMAAMSDGGPVAAIEVCSQQASEIAANVGREFGVSIGRTSYRLRNPANRAPAWTQPFVEVRETDPQFVDLSNGGTGALLPILLQPQCLACHGPADKINANVGEQLKKLYPDDAATGFHQGDLRGWFWVEVPH